MSPRCWELALPVIAVLPTHLGAALAPDEMQLVDLLWPGFVDFAMASEEAPTEVVAEIRDITKSVGKTPCGDRREGGPAEKFGH